MRSAPGVPSIQYKFLAIQSIAIDLIWPTCGPSKRISHSPELSPNELLKQTRYKQKIIYLYGHCQNNLMQQFNHGTSWNISPLKCLRQCKLKTKFQSEINLNNVFLCYFIVFEQYI